MRTTARAVATAALVLALGGCSYIGAKPTPDDETPSPVSSIVSATDTPSVAPSPEGFVSEADATELIQQCGVGGHVAAYFRIPVGKDYRDHFPEMGRSPEIEGVSSAFVVVYDDPVSALVLGAPGASREPLTNALCVVPPSGYPIVYGNVSREGMVLPAGAYLASPSVTDLPTPSPVGRQINEVEAIEIARRGLADSDSATVWGFESGQFSYLFRRYEYATGGMQQPLPDVVASDAPVWAIVFQKAMEICSPPPPQCETRLGLLTVFVSSDSGEWLMSSTYSPSSPRDLPTPMYGSEPIVDPLRLSISNGTTLAITLVVNGQTLEPFAPSAHEDPIDPTLLASPPWHVEARTLYGRLLTTLDVQPGDLWHTTGGPDGASTHKGNATQVDLSCGRLDIWAGPPLAGPPPPSSFAPGDCAP